MGARIRRRTRIEAEGEIGMKNIDLIQNILSKQQGVDDYSIFATDTSSYELFFVRGKLETVRKSVHSSAQASVYVDHDGKRGSASFGLDESAGEDEIKRKAAEAAARAKIIYDESYTLPCDSEKTDAEIPSDLCGKNEKQIAAEVAKAVERACTRKDCGINALEVFVVTKTSSVRNSAGVDKTQRKHTVSIEAIPTCDSKAESVELFEAYTFGSLDADGITREIAARLDDVAARAQAVKPASKITCPVILNPYEISTLFEELVADADYARTYLHSNLHSIGESWQSDPAGDKLTVTMRGLIEGSPNSALFDRDGTSLVDRLIIDGGKIVDGYGTNRFAQYLGQKATGALGCFDVGAGSVSVKQMTVQPHLECVYLSGLQVDLYNDYIGGEIRLAYYFDGKTRIPVTGIAMSGKLSEVLNTITLSKEIAVLGGYRGPQKICLEKMNIF